MMPKHPDNIVFNEYSERYDASKRSYPTNVGSQKFEPIKLDKSNSVNANNYFDAKFKELRDSYQKLVRSINGTKLFMNQNFPFNQKWRRYFLYQKENKSYWLSIISPKIGIKNI